LYLWSSHDVLPTLGLDVHLFEAEAIEENHSINASISNTANALKI
jgi:hypothetical protein